MSTKPTQYHKAKIVGAVFIMGVILAVINTGGYLLPNNAASLGPSAVLELPVNHRLAVQCALSEMPCKIRLGEFAFDLRVPSAPLKPFSPIDIELQVRSPQLAQAEWFLWFEGRDMDMGLHWLHSSNQLDQSNQQQTEVAKVQQSQIKSYQGMIPVCSVDEAMTWRLNVQVAWQGEVYRSVFDFQVEH